MGAGVDFEGRWPPVDLRRGLVDLFKMFTRVELEVTGELGAGHARLALKLNFVKQEDGIVSSADVKLGGRKFKLIGLKS